ncbi:hypothetical protein C8Q70DRAFT_424233 [Cubamyces menziesii]|nr:hypothetical protein C8Q70DRAFT_424233 [Cubamyces menziesii]
MFSLMTADGYSVLPSARCSLPMSVGVDLHAGGTESFFSCPERSPTGRQCYTQQRSAACLQAPSGHRWSWHRVGTLTQWILENGSKLRHCHAASTLSSAPSARTSMFLTRGSLPPALFSARNTCRTSEVSGRMQRHSRWRDPEGPVPSLPINYYYADRTHATTIQPRPRQVQKRGPGTRKANRLEPTENAVHALRVKLFRRKAEANGQGAIPTCIITPISSSSTLSTDPCFVVDILYPRCRV